MHDCPGRCDDAAITLDWSTNKPIVGNNVVRVVIDCEHSGVCAKKGCNAYNAIAAHCAISPLEIMGLEAALRSAVQMAHLSRPGEEEDAIRAISCLIPAGLEKNDAERLAQKIACYGNVDTWLKARDMKKELDNGEA